MSQSPNPRMSLRASIPISQSPNIPANFQTFTPISILPCQFPHFHSTLRTFTSVRGLCAHCRAPGGSPCLSPVLSENASANLQLRANQAIRIPCEKPSNLECPVIRCKLIFSSLRRFLSRTIEIWNCDRTDACQRLVWLRGQGRGKNGLSPKKSMNQSGQN
jgi:hypothetical protein